MGLAEGIGGTRIWWDVSGTLRVNLPAFWEQRENRSVAFCEFLSIEATSGESLKGSRFGSRVV